jgi:hypothetical protein
MLQKVGNGVKSGSDKWSKQITEEMWTGVSDAAGAGKLQGAENQQGQGEMNKSTAMP